MGVRDLSCDVEPQPQAGGRVMHSVGDLIEALEYLVAVLGLYAWAVVHYRYYDLSISVRNLNVDGGVIR